MIQEGMLSKFSVGRGSLSRKNWKERWFISDEEALKYFSMGKTTTAYALKGTVMWDSVVCVYDTLTAEVHPHANEHGVAYFGMKFKESGKDLILLLRARSEEERSAWLETFSERCGVRLTAEQIRELEDEEELGGLRRHPHVDDPRPRRDSRSPPSAIHILRGLVSRNKKRYIDRGFNLDLVYITRNIIAMGYPAQGREALYRNSMDEVERFLSTFHSGRYKVYNLCKEKEYASDRFDGNWVRYPFEDHNPPPLDLIAPCVEDMHDFLSAHRNNVVAVHCKAGKGRTGTIICAYLCSVKGMTADEALALFGRERTTDGKGVTIPSQKRYVHYHEKLSRRGLQHVPHQPITLKSIVLSSIPKYGSDGTTVPYVLIQQRRVVYPEVVSADGMVLHEASFREGVSNGSISSKESKKEKFEVVYDSRSHCQVRKLACGKVEYKCHTPCELAGDVRFAFVDDSKRRVKGPLEVCHCWLNTAFMEVDASGATGCTVLDKESIDGANKDEQHEYFDEGFSVEFHYEIPPLPKSPSFDTLRNPSAELLPSTTSPLSPEPQTRSRGVAVLDPPVSPVVTRGGSVFSNGSGAHTSPPRPDYVPALSQL